MYTAAYFFPFKIETFTVGCVSLVLNKKGLNSDYIISGTNMHKIMNIDGEVKYLD